MIHPLWVLPDLEDICRSFVEDPGITEEQASIVTPIFDINMNYKTSQLKMIYQSDTPVISASSNSNSNSD
jgi:hypothetical protein